MSKGIADEAEHALLAVSKELQGAGKIIKHSTPLHAASVHFPIALLSVSFAVDTLALLPDAATKLTKGLLPDADILAHLSFYIAGLGLLTAAPAVVTGLGEFYAMARSSIRKLGLVGAYQQDSVQGEKIRTTSTHAALNDLSIGIAAWNFFNRSKNVGHALDTHHAVASALALPMLFYAASLGGKLTYVYGMGVQRQSEGLRVKRDEKKE